MKLALVHEWLTNMAGSERVLLAMHQLWPQAPIHTSVYAPEALPPEFGRATMDVRTSWLQHLPGATTRWRMLLPLMPGAFESFDLSGYDVVLTNCHQCAKGVLTPVDTLHICYCYTPIRYAWEMPARYLAEAGRLQRLVLPGVLRRLRQWDYVAAQRPDLYIAISQFVQRRIEKHYRREVAAVIYPPIVAADYAPAPGTAPPPREDFYLVVSRLVGYKQVELAAAAFARLGKRLKIVGVGPEEGRVRAAAGPTVELLGWRDDAAVRQLYARARALVFCGVEDFGLTPVEAQAAGCPVIALGAGGALETVLEGETGLFFATPSVDQLCDAVRRFEATEFSAARCVAQAARFDVAVFQRQLADLVSAASARG